MQMQENVQFYMASEGSREWAKAVEESLMASTLSGILSRKDPDGHLAPPPFPDIYICGTRPRIFHMGGEEDALHLLFSISPKARCTVAEIAARKLVEGLSALSKVTSDPIIQSAISNPFQYELDFSRTLTKGSQLTPQQMKDHLLAEGNSLVFLRLFRLLVDHCRPREIIGNHWASDYKYDGFSFVNAEGHAEQWLPRRWLERNARKVAFREELDQILAMRRPALPAPQPMPTP